MAARGRRQNLQKACRGALPPRNLPFHHEGELETCPDCQRSIDPAPYVNQDPYPFWVNRVGALVWIAEGFVQLLSPWQPTWSLRFYSWWVDKEAASG